MRIIKRFQSQRRTVSSLALISTLTALVVTGLGCGGGTTGTSPSDTLKFSGFAEQADGERAGSLTMTVSSTTTNDPLLDSGTDAQGVFSMDLPAEEESLTIEVAGVGRTTVVRSQRGDGAMTAKLKVSAQGTLAATQLFEAQIEPDSLCSSITPSGTSLLISGPTGQQACPVTIRVTSREIAATSFTGSLRATCNGQPETVATTRASADGAIRIDLLDAFSQGCTQLSIAVTTPRAPGLEALFVVY